MHTQSLLWQVARDHQAEIRAQAEVERKLRGLRPSRPGGFPVALGTLGAALLAVTLAAALMASTAGAYFSGGGGAGPIPFI